VPTIRIIRELDEQIVQTFTFAGYPDGVSLERLVFEDLGGGRPRLIAQEDEAGADH
jgi:hypothetical protein